MNEPKWLIIHHTGVNPAQSFEIINEYHRQKWDFISSLGYYIGYHYYIDVDGIVKQGRADTDEGAHCIGYNLKSLGICLAGNFDQILPNEAQIKSLKKLLLELSLKYKIQFEQIVPHRKFANKSCYGDMLEDEWASDLVAKTGIASLKKNQIKDEIKGLVDLL